MVKELVKNQNFQPEIEKRKQEKIKSIYPIANEKPYFSGVISMCQDYIKQSYDEKYFDENFPHYLYNGVLIAIYGKYIFNWINSF